jgi:hypothetical protein
MNTDAGAPSHDVHQGNHMHQEPRNGVRALLHWWRLPHRTFPLQSQKLLIQQPHKDQQTAQKAIKNSQVLLSTILVNKRPMWDTVLRSQGTTYSAAFFERQLTSRILC